MMKAEINYTPVFNNSIRGITNEGFLRTQAEVVNTINRIFLEILYACTTSCTKEDLQSKIHVISHTEEDFPLFFMYGFGSNHLWVKQVNNQNTPVLPYNMIFVEF